MNKYDVGQDYKEFLRKNEIIKANFDGFYIDIFFLLKGIKPEILKNIQSSNPFFQIYTKNDIIFLLIKFQNVDWFDIPYIQEENISLKPINGINDGYPVNLLCADINSGKVLAKRHLCLNNGLSKAFYFAIKKQMENPPKNSLQKINSIRASFHSNEIALLSLGK